MDTRSLTHHDCVDGETSRDSRTDHCVGSEHTTHSSGPTTSRMILSLSNDRKFEILCLSVSVRVCVFLQKYPLLLAELLKATPEDHPDRNNIVAALDVIKEAAQEMNESKRRKEVCLKL